MPPLRDLHKTISGDFVFNVLTLKQVFEKQKPFEKLDCSFLVESKNIESATFSCKTDLSKANLKTSRMGGTKWTYHKEYSFVTNYLRWLAWLI